MPPGAALVRPRNDTTNLIFETGGAVALTRNVLNGSALLMSGQVLGQGFGFVRNIIVARLLGPEDFGVAAIFVITLSLLDMISNLAADRMIIQADDGEDPRLQNTAHTLLGLRGFVTAALIYLAAGPIVWLFKVPDAKWAFELLALIPIARGFLHLDVKRLQRQMRFSPYVMCEAAGQLAGLLVSVPLAFYLRDYSAVLWITLVQVGMLVLVSHMLSERVYRWGWYKPHVRRFVSFGWPLLIDGLLMFGIFQGDRVIIGANYDQAALGIYAVAFSLTLLPTLMLSRVNSALVLPLLSTARGDSALFNKRFRLTNEVLALAGGSIAVGFILAGGWFVPLVYGPAYAQAGNFIGILGAMQAVRVIRSAPSEAAMALGETHNFMISNGVRSTALIGLLIAALLHTPLWVIASCGLIGELLGLLTSVLLLRAQHHIPARHTLLPFNLTLATMAAAAVVYASFPEAPWYLLLAGVLALIIGMLAYGILRFEISTILLEAWQRSRRSAVGDKA